MKGSQRLTAHREFPLQRRFTTESTESTEKGKERESNHEAHEGHEEGDDGKCSSQGQEQEDDRTPFHGVLVLDKGIEDQFE